MKRLLILLLLIIVGNSVCASSLKVYNLTCDYHNTPLALENFTPRLSWQIESSVSDTEIASYQIIIADNVGDITNNVGNVWDSGVVQSGESVNILYAGKPLQKGKEYVWSVKVVDKKGNHSDWSKVAMWRQAPMPKSRNWIAFKSENDTNECVASVYYRKSFTLSEAPLKEAYAEISTPGYYELYINGRRVGTDILSPAVSGKDKRTFYVTYAVSKYLKKGKNNISIHVGKGWFGFGGTPIHFNCDVLQQNGNVRLETDTSWRCSRSNYSTLGSWEWGQFGGERIDCNAEIKNWNSLTFDDSKWFRADSVESPSPVIVAQPCELNRMNKGIVPEKITQIGMNRFEVDFGTNMTGIAQLNFLNVNKGDTVRIYYAERRWNDPNHEPTPAGIVAASMADRKFVEGNDTLRYSIHNQMDEIISRGGKNTFFKSKFNYHGFRYAIIEGVSVAPTMAEAYLVDTDLRRVGRFECSNSLLNEIHKLHDQTVRSLNMGGVYVDCPTRERLGYGDGQVSIESSVTNYYMPLFYRKFIKDWTLRQDSMSGKLPNVAPNYQGGGGPAWAGIVAAMSWRNYLYYNDIDGLKDAYPAMMHYLEYLETRTIDGVLRGDPSDQWQSIGDWLAPNRGMDGSNWPNIDMADFFNNCYWVYLWEIQQKAAKALGLEKDVLKCQSKIETVRATIHNAFYDKQKGYYLVDEPSYLVMPLMSSVVPDSLRESIDKKLEVKLRESGSLNAGMLGTYFLIQYLQDNNKSELLYLLVNHTRYPGLGYMLSQGATTIWEQWNGFWSQIHSCFTSLDGWFYQGIAGIRPLEEFPGMKEFIIRPTFLHDLNNVDVKTETPYGDVECRWNVKNQMVNLVVAIPVNSRARLYLPKGYKLSNPPMVVTDNNQEQYYLLKSGTHEFNLKK